MAQSKEAIEKKSNRQKNDEAVDREVRPEKYSGLRKQERKRTQERDNTTGQQREETDYSSTGIKVH